jgi:hypothetical protein
MSVAAITICGCRYDIIFTLNLVLSGVLLLPRTGCQTVGAAAATSNVDELNEAGRSLTSELTSIRVKQEQLDTQLEVNSARIDNLTNVINGMVFTLNGLRATVCSLNHSRLSYIVHRFI